MAKYAEAPDRWDMEVDLVAAGSSGGGLVAAILGHDFGLSTVVLEAAEGLGGGTALSGGALWIPYNDHMLAAGMVDSREETLMYIRGVSMGHHDEEELATYLDTGPRMLRYLEEHTPLKMVIEADGSRTEYCADLPGGKPEGRKICPDPEVMPQILGEAEKVHPLVAKVRRDTVRHLIGPRHPWHQGRALVGSLVLACVDRGIDILTNTRATRLIVRDGRVIGLRAEREGRDFFVRGRKGVLLATGGFEWNREMNKRFIHSPPLHAVTPPTNRGDGHIMGMELGAAVALMDHGIFQPGFHVPGERVDDKPDGERAYRVFLHGYPGMILVNRHSRRCCDESFYPDIGRALLAYDRIRGEFANAPLFWIADQAFRDTVPVLNLHRGTEMADWLVRADTLPELAGKLGLAADTLVDTVERFNGPARDGRDPEFHRGESTFDRQWGGFVFPGRQPSTVLGPVERPPFYGVQIELATVGNLGGLVVNSNAQVVDARGEAIPGLYGAGNTTALLVIGHHYESGASQGKSMIWGYIAARHMAGAGEKQE